MKVLYIGVYRDHTGWGEAATNTILALDSAGVDVVCRPIKLNNNEQPIPERLRELEARPTKGCDVVIQNVLPHMLSANCGFKKNIAFYETETSNFRSSSWANHINLMDAALVASTESQFASIDSGVTIPLHVIPHAYDTDKFYRSYEKISFGPTVDPTFKFYWVGEINARKNLEVLIKAFHLAFDPTDSVSLIIKTTNKKQEEVAAFCESVKRNLKLYADPKHYKQEIIIDSYLPEDQLMALHNTCDAFVCPSSGEAWSYPTFIALGLGSLVIAPHTQGFKHYLNDVNSLRLETMRTPCYGETEQFGDLFTGRELWDEVRLDSLIEQMRRAKYVDNSNLIENGMEIVHCFSREAVGAKLKRILQEIYNA